MEMSCVPRTSFGRAPFWKVGEVNKLLLTHLYIYMDLGTQFLKDLGLIRSKVTCNTFGRDMTWCADPKHDGFRWRCRRWSVVVCSESKSIKSDPHLTRPVRHRHTEDDGQPWHNRINSTSAGKTHLPEKSFEEGKAQPVPAPYFLHAMTDKYVFTSTGSPCPHHEGIWGGGIALLLLSFGTRCRCGQLHAPATLPRERITVLIDQEAENCTLLCYYAASSGNFLLTFRVSLSVPPLRVQESSLSPEGWYR